MPATPLCRCRVLYIGSAVPLKSKDGLQGIQEPLKQLYPADDVATPTTSPQQKLEQSGPTSQQILDAKGVDAWLSIWINGLVLEYVSDSDKEQFFPIQTLHYCAAVRYVNVHGYALEGGGEKFLPLDSPFANLPDTTHPPIFAAIMRRTQGVRVLECHAFVCTNEKAANALVKCCFNAYADSMYLDLTNPAENGHALDSTAEKSLMGLRGQAPRGLDDIDSVSPKSDDKNGYHDLAAGVDDDQGARSDDPEKEQQKWAEAKSKYAWAHRQQAGDYETASISSSVAGKYKKKERSSKQVSSQGSTSKAPAGTMPQHKRPPSVAASYSNALVPYGQPPAQYMTSRRAKSEIDLQTASRNALVPYMPHFPHGGPMMMPPPPGAPMFFPPPTPNGAFLPPPPPPHHHHLGPPGPPMMGWGGGPPPQPPPMFGGPPLPPFTMPPSMKKKQKQSKSKKLSKQRNHYTLAGGPPFSHMMNAQYAMMGPPPAPMMGPPFRSFEEPPYLPGQMPPPPPHMRFGPFNDFPPMGPRSQPFGFGPGNPQPYVFPHQVPGPDVSPYDEQEEYHESYRNVKSAGKQRPSSKSAGRYRDFDRRSIDESTTSSKHSASGEKRSPVNNSNNGPADYWENRNVYDGTAATLFRRQNLHEKAFGATIHQDRSRHPFHDRLPPEPLPDYSTGLNGHNHHRTSEAIEDDEIEGRFRNMDMNYKRHEERRVYQTNY